MINWTSLNWKTNTFQKVLSWIWNYKPKSEYFHIILSNKVLTSRIYKEFFQLNKTDTVLYAKYWQNSGADIFIRLFQRNNLCVCVYKEMYYEELAHTIMEAANSKDLQSASWWPRKLMSSFSPSSKVWELGELMVEAPVCNWAGMRLKKS